MSKKREDLLAEVLDDAGILSPLINTMVEQLEAETKPKAKSRKRRGPPSAARQNLMHYFPNASEEELDALETST